jgi:NAD-dependent deacetylase
MKKNLVVLSGAGISAESGIRTFRDSDGLWEGHDVAEVATPMGWFKNPSLVLDFYNQRRRQLLQCHPNQAHEMIANLESSYYVNIITQNVDDLHERAGSTNVLHLHGELLKSRSTLDESLVYSCTSDILLGTCCEKGFQLRPHIVWFGEEVPNLQKAIPLVQKADLLIVIGTSLQVYPAAGLVGFANHNANVYYIDPKPASSYEMRTLKNLEIIPLSAIDGMIYLNALLQGKPVE